MAGLGVWRIRTQLYESWRRGSIPLGTTVAGSGVGSLRQAVNLFVASSILVGHLRKMPQ